MYFDPSLPLSIDELSSESIIEEFQRRAVERINSCEKPKIEPDIIVVCGAPRSGTTLLNYILCSSPETNPLIPECTHLLFVLDAIRKVIDTEQKFPRAFFAETNEIYDAGRAAIDQLVNSVKKRYGCSKVVLKNPAMSPYVPLLIKMFRNRVRCIGIVRNPEDVISSMKVWAEKSKENNQNHFYEHLDVAGFCQYLLTFYNFLISSTDDEISSIFLTRYENLVLNPKEQVDRYSQLLRLDLSSYEPTAEWKNTKLDLSSGGTFDLAHTPLYDKPISTQSIGSAQSRLSSDERYLIARLCENFCYCFDYLTDLDIPKDFEEISPINPREWLLTLEPNALFRKKVQLANRNQAHREQLQRVRENYQKQISKLKEMQTKMREETLVKKLKRRISDLTNGF